jgi:hypothetical protein
MVQCADCGVLPREPLSAWPWNRKSHYLGVVEIPKLATELGVSGGEHVFLAFDKQQVYSEDGRCAGASSYCQGINNARQVGCVVIDAAGNTRAFFGSPLAE